MPHKLFLSLLMSLFFISACSHFENLPTVPLGEGEVINEHEAFGHKYMMATQGKLSTDAGREILKRGGNLVDAAVAISFALSVERPQSTGLGGGGFMLLALPGWSSPIALDFREEAPMKAHEKMFLNQKGEVIPNLSSEGIFSGGVPGLVAGLTEVHQQFGKLPLKMVMSPAIRMAKNGFFVYPYLAHCLKETQELLGKYPASKKIFFHQDGSLLREGDLLVQKDLAKTLELIAEKGKNGFYQGKVAEKIVLTQKKYGGLITLNDLNQYRPRTRKPVHGTFKGYDIYSMGPPSSGGTHVIEILNILENDPLKEFGAGSAMSVHQVAEAMKLAFVDRAAYMGDADFVSVPVKGLISKEYAHQLREKIRPNKTLEVSSLQPGKASSYESPETTHFTLMSSDGAVISSTQTINGYFGSGIVIGDTGVLLNNEMDDFATKVGEQNIYGAVGGEKNLIEPKKRPLSSMSPSIVYENNRPLLALGTPSGTRILTCVAQTLLNYLDYQMPLYESLASVRFHHQWHPDELWVEDPGLSVEVEKTLTDLGHHIKRKNLGCRIQAVALEKGTLHGVSDPRGEGTAGGE